MMSLQWSSVGFTLYVLYCVYSRVGGGSKVERTHSIAETGHLTHFRV